MISIARKLALYASGSPSLDLVVLDIITEGVDGATDVTHTTEAINTLKIGANRSILQSFQLNIDIRTLVDVSIVSDLVNYAKSGQKTLKIAILGLGSHFVSSDTYSLVFNEQASSTYVYAFKITKNFVGNGYDVNGEKTAKYHQGANILGIYEVDEYVGSDLAGFFTSENITIVNTNPGEVELTNNEVTAATYQNQSIFFPFAGETLTASLTLADSDDASNEIGIAYYDSSGAAISSSTTSMGLSTGRKSHSSVVPSNTAYARMYVGIVAAKLVTFSEPCLRNDNSTTFTML